MRLFIFFLFLTSSIVAQDITQISLNKMEDEALLTLFNEVEFDSIKAEKVARTYLDRARKENDTIKMARGYDRLASIFHPEKNIQFADSVIFLTKDIENITFPAQAYALKGYEYGIIGDLKLSTKNYVKAYDIALINKNVQQQLFASNRLIFSKSIWGNKIEALELQIERHKIIKNKNYLKEIKKSTREGFKHKIEDLKLSDEISSFENFAFCYLNLKQLDSARKYVEEGLLLNKKYNGSESIKKNHDLFFKEISVEIDYYETNYQNVINKSNELLPTLKLNNDIKSIQNIFLFKGLTLIALKSEEEGINYLRKTDSMYDKHNYTIMQPYQRVLYEKLLKYYNDQENTIKKIEYLKKLIDADSIIKRNYQFFEPTLIKEFENPELFKEKEQIIKELKSDNIKSKSFLWITLGILSSSILLILIYYKKQRTYKVRFKELMVKNKDLNTTTNSNALKVPSEIYNDILKKLENFEQNRGFLKCNISINKLAKDFGTNQKYLSKVINIEKENNFSQYINNLKVSYVFKELQVNERLRSFTIIAIAKESGFKSSESFSRAFYKKYKIKPSFYIIQLNK